MSNQEILLSSHARAIAHLRSQVRKKRFGLVLGAGVSVDFKVPMWSDLVQMIAADSEVEGTDLLNGEAKKYSWPYKTELLFQAFRKKKVEASGGPEGIEQENTVAAEWLKLCQKYIYQNIEKNVETALTSHTYMKELIPLIQASYLTINFNFDDFVEQCLGQRKREIDKSNRGFEAVTDPWPQFRRTDSVIYHLHGYVPRGIMEGTVDRFVFSEAAYSKQYVGARGHDAAFMTAHFARNTCLLIGCSLEDELRNVLMRGAQINPGNYHYYFHYVADHKSVSEIERQRIEETNFKVYNLITLFVTSEEIADLLQLINPDVTSEAQLRDMAAISGARLRFTFYMTGAIGVGKSTTANLLRSLTVFDEWLEARPEILGKPWDQLTEPEREESDTWIAGQFKKKNDALRHLEEASIRVIDRPPLDPLAFTPESKRAAKAQSLLKAICNGNAHPIEHGVVILLRGIPEELSARVRATGRQDYTRAKLEKMQNDIESIYGDKVGVVVIDARFLTIAEVTKRVAQVIHREEYAPADLMSIMQGFAEESNVPAQA